MLHTKYKGSGPCCFREEDFNVSPIANDAPGIACMDPRGMFGMIHVYKGGYYTLLHTKHKKNMAV